MTPSWVAASPTPSASCMIAIIRSRLAASSGPELAHLRGARTEHRVAEGTDLGQRRARRSRSSSVGPPSYRPPSASPDRASTSCSAVSLIVASLEPGPPALLRIDVDRKRELAQAPRRSRSLDHRPDSGHRRTALARLDDHLAAMAPAETEPGRRAEGPVARWQRGADLVAQAFGRRLNPIGVGSAQLDPDQMREGRVAERPPPLELAGEEARCVVSGGVADRRRVGGERLDQDPAAAAGPRPLRPASWATRAKVRSSARKSGKRRVASASSTTRAPRRGSRDPWRPSGCRPAPRPAPPGTRPGSRGGLRRGRRCRSRAGTPAAARPPPRSAPRAARCRRRGGRGTPSRSPDRSPGSARRARSGGSAARCPGGGRARRRSRGTPRCGRTSDTTGTAPSRAG